MRRTSAIVMVFLFVIVCGLCAGAVVQIRDAEARMQCQNNLKMIGLSIIGYAESYHGVLPRTTAWRMTKGKQAHLPVEKQASLFYDVCPFIESRMDPKFYIDPTQAVDADDNRYVVDSWSPVFLCPANSNIGATKNYTHYVGITGVGRDAALLPLSDPRCGMFGFERTTTLMDIAKADGRSTTLALVETSTDNGPWAIGGHGTARGLDVEGIDYLGEHGQFNSLHGRSWTFGRPVLTNACFADGSVRGLSSDLSVAVFEALATIAGGEQLPPDW